MNKEMMVVTAERFEDTFTIDAWFKCNDERDLEDKEVIKVEPNYVEVIAYAYSDDADLSKVEQYTERSINGRTFKTYTDEWRVAANCFMRDVCDKAIRHIKKHNPEFVGIEALDKAMKEEHENGFF